MSLLLLAQLVTPPLQQGPVRLPENRPGLERSVPTRPSQEQPTLDVAPDTRNDQPQLEP